MISNGVALSAWLSLGNSPHLSLQHVLMITLPQHALISRLHLTSQTSPTVSSPPKHWRLAPPQIGKE